MWFLQFTNVVLLQFGMTAGVVLQFNDAMLLQFGMTAGVVLTIH